MLSGMGGMTAFAPMLRQLGGAMLGGQVGTAIGELASEMATSTDIGLPLAPEGTAALLPAGVAAFGDGLSVDPGEVRLFLALREAAHHRLFGHVPWLRQHLLGAVEAYAAGITIDMSKLRDALPDMDMANPEEALRGALSGETLFRPEDSPQQKAALSRLETALALVEGWVATVVAAAADSRLVHSAALAEAIRRRRASGGPSERTFAALVGLELRPRMLREAAVLWADVTEARGIEGRDALWAHPDLLPTADDLANPDGFLRGATELDISDLEEGPASDGGRPGRDARTTTRGRRSSGDGVMRASGRGSGAGRSRLRPRRRYRRDGAASRGAATASRAAPARAFRWRRLARPPGRSASAPARSRGRRSPPRARCRTPGEP